MYERYDIHERNLNPVGELEQEWQPEDFEIVNLHDPNHQHRFTATYFTSSKMLVMGCAYCNQSVVVTTELTVIESDGNECKHEWENVLVGEDHRWGLKCSKCNEVRG